MSYSWLKNLSLQPIESQTVYLFLVNWYQKPSGSPTRSIEFCINWFCGSVYLPSAGGFRIIKIDQQNHHRLFHPQNNRVPKKCQMPTRTLKLNHDGWVDWYLMLIVLHNYDNVTMINLTAPQAKKPKSTALTRNCSFFATTEQSKKRSGNNKTTLFC